MPGHSRGLKNRNSVRDIIFDTLEVRHTCIIIILAREQRSLEPGRVDIGKRVIMRIPTAVTEIDTANGSDVVIHDHNLFVVGPKLNRVCGRVLD